VVERIGALAVEYAELLTSDAEGVVGAFIRTSVTTGTPFDNSYIALTRLAQSGIHPEAREALLAIESDWTRMIESEVGDPAVARLVMLVSDGLYYNSALSAALPSASHGASLDDVITAIGDLVRARGR
jgi:hypothetical protein